MKKANIETYFSNYPSQTSAVVTLRASYGSGDGAYTFEFDVRILKATS